MDSGQINLILGTIASFVISGSICFFIKRPYLAVVLAIVVPLVFIILAVFIFMQEDLADWAMALSIGMGYSLIGSIAGIFAVKLAANKDQ